MQLPNLVMLAHPFLKEIEMAVMRWPRKIFTVSCHLKLP